MDCHPVEPFRIKSVERRRVPDAAERRAMLDAAHYNPFRIPSRAVFIDLLTTAAASAEEIARRLEAVRQGTQEAVGRGIEAIDATLIGRHQRAAPCSVGPPISRWMDERILR